ncbi:bmk-1 [Pristionchus pacificus]|uniref:Kinesin-like protein n=1 Tax=Pristionchus pacificus TaxID=54126 RepID=A0A454XZK5_PRIPA|nr:bmk-1 [Pristionchus pacificus]|eukprot:PDM61202.1 bmk-1 [Pristionchus pacificus]
MMSAMKKKPTNSGVPARSNVAVAIRVRPPNEKEAKDSLIVKTDPIDRSVTIRNKVFSNFERVYGQNSRQSEIYKDLVKKQVEDVLRGYNCTIFAYGQTGTGKTYTMEGGEGSIEGDWETDENTGIIPRAAQHIFTELTAKTGIEYIVRLSYVEIYNEEMIDLLSSPSSDDKHLIRLFEDPAKKGTIVISGVEDIPVRCRDDVYRLLKQGTEQRRTAETLMNKQSSRSHSVLTISVLIRESLPSGEELVKQGKLRLVDLAGSENIGRSGAEGKRAKEAGNINTSLLALGRVINALTTNAPHIPYRESKLTRLLQDSLGGSSITTIIATLSPVNTNFDESVSTLEYAHRAMNIKNRPEINENVNKKDLFKEYSGQIERLMRELKAARDKSGVYLDQELYDEMGKKIETSEERISLLEQQLEDTLELMRKHLADIELMDDYYGKAYTRVRNLEQRLALRVEELEEAKMTIAKEKQAHEETRRALGRCRSHAEEAFTVAEETKKVGWEAHHELMRLHPRCDAIGEIANENRNVSLELSRSINESIPPMREANDLRMKNGEEKVKEAETALNVLNEAVAEKIPATKESIDEANETMKSLLSRLSSIHSSHNENAQKETSLLVTMIRKAQLHLESTIDSVVTQLIESNDEGRIKVEEMEHQNEIMRKEMDQLRSDCREAIATAQMKRMEAGEELEKKRNQFKDEMERKTKDMMNMMNSFVSSMSSMGETIEEGQRGQEETIAERMNQMGEVEMGWGDEMDETCEKLKNMMNESTEKTKDQISTCLPILSSMGQKTEDYGRKSEIDREDWKKERETIEEECRGKHELSLSSALSSIDSLKETHDKTQVDTVAALENTKSIIAESWKEVDGDMDKLMKIVIEETERIREIPPKDVEQVQREFQDNQSPPTEEELFAESEDEVEEGEENDENDQQKKFKEKAKLRRSNFRVRDSLLVGGDDLQSPSKLIGMRGQRIEEEGSEASFGSDRTNRRTNN